MTNYFTTPSKTHLAQRKGRETERTTRIAQNRINADEQVHVGTRTFSVFITTLIQRKHNRPERQKATRVTAKLVGVSCE
jgi:hypothetical protein